MVRDKIKDINARAYLIRGEDEYTGRRKLERLLESLVAPEFADFDLEVIDGEHATADRVAAGLQIAPFGPGRRVVLLRFANKMNADEQRRLAGTLDTIPDSGCLVILTPAPEKVDGRPKSSSEVVAELSKAVRKVGLVITTGGGKAGEKAARARAFIAERFAEAGKKIQPQAAGLLIERAGTDLAVLDSEISKLLDYCGDSRLVTTEDAECVTSETPEERIFKLVDAVATGDKAGAVRLVRRHLEAAGRPESEVPRTVGMLARQFRLLWQFKMLAEAGVRDPGQEMVPDNVSAMLPAEPNLPEVLARQPWMTRSLAAQARPFNRRRLARCFELIAAADREVKGIDDAGGDPQAVLELLVVRLASLRQTG